MNASIGSLIFHTVYLLAFPLALFCSQWLQSAAPNSAWTWSIDFQDCSWKSAWTRLPQVCLPCLTSSSNTVGLCVFSCALTHPKAGAHTLSFMLQEHCPSGLQHNPHIILMSLNRTSSPLIAKDNNCMAGQKGKRRARDNPYIEDVTVVSG